MSYLKDYMQLSYRIWTCQTHILMYYFLSRLQFICPYFLCIISLLFLLCAFVFQ